MAIWAKGVSANVYENFTDVDAIYSASPDIVKNPKPISIMTYSELRELSYAGFKVFNDEAVLPAIKGNIPINVKNTNFPNKKGTLILPAEKIHNNLKKNITGIASQNNFDALYLHRYFINREVGFGLKILKILSDLKISYEHMPSGIDDVTIIINQDQLTKKKKDILTKKIRAQIKPDSLAWKNNYAIIMIVGQGMLNQVESLSKIISPLKKANILINMVNQGASETSIMLGIGSQDEKEAVKAIYQANFKNKGNKKS